MTGLFFLLFLFRVISAYSNDGQKKLADLTPYDHSLYLTKLSNFVQKLLNDSKKKSASSSYLIRSCILVVETKEEEVKNFGISQHNTLQYDLARGSHSIPKESLKYLSQLLDEDDRKKLWDLIMACHTMSKRMTSICIKDPSNLLAEIEKAIITKQNLLNYLLPSGEKTNISDSFFSDQLKKSLENIQRALSKKIFFFSSRSRGQILLQNLQVIENLYGLVKNTAHRKYFLSTLKELLSFLDKEKKNKEIDSKIINIATLYFGQDTVFMEEISSFARKKKRQMNEVFNKLSQGRADIIYVNKSGQSLREMDNIVSDTFSRYGKKVDDMDPLHGMARLDLQAPLIIQRQIKKMIDDYIREKDDWKKNRLF